jgi:hypothetical protein
MAEFVVSFDLVFGIDVKRSSFNSPTSSKSRNLGILFFSRYSLMLQILKHKLENGYSDS